MARAAAGMADDLLTATLLTARCPVLYAPATAQQRCGSTRPSRRTSALLRAAAPSCLPPGGRPSHRGPDSGAGRLPDPAETFAAAVRLLLPPSTPRTPKGPATLAGRMRGGAQLGGTWEEIDPVRFIGNWSTGDPCRATAPGLVRRRPGGRSDRGRGQRRPARSGRRLGHPGRLGPRNAGRDHRRRRRRRCRGHGGRGWPTTAPRHGARARSRRTGSRPSRCAWSRTRTSWLGWPPSGSAAAAASARSWSGSPPKPIPPSRRPGPSWPAKGVTLLAVNPVGNGLGFGTADNEAVVFGADGTVAQIPRGLRRSPRQCGVGLGGCQPTVSAGR